VDDRADIFSLGIVFWEQLTGKRLFFDNQPLLAIRKVIEFEIPLPSSVNPNVPKSIDAIAMKALERDIQKRYQLAKEFGADIERAVFNEGVVYGEKQAREHLAKIYGDTISVENQSLISKVSWQAFSEPTLSMNLPPLPSSLSSKPRKVEKTISLAIPLQQPAAERPPSSFSFANIAMALLLVAAGGWGAMKFRGDLSVPQPQESSAVAQSQAQKPAAAPQRAPAQLLERKEMDRLVLSQGPLDELDVQLISAFRSGFAKRPNVLPQVVVKVTKGGNRPVALVLASFEAIDWRVIVERGVKLERVLLSERSDEISATQVNVSGEESSVNIEYVNLGFLPLSADNRTSMLQQKTDLTGANNMVKIGSPEDAAFSLNTEICFQDSISQTQFVTGRCQKYGSH